jgi:uncharacterized pyridoxamine 5'-phosphate oxidase family protein/NAD-dependent dihydropyrimidine dehydrogenase PreA subunit
MDAAGCIEKCKRVGVLDFATVDASGAPQVRNISAIHYEGMALYFLTARGKYFADELRADGRVQILAYTMYKETIRLSGRAFEVPAQEQQKWMDRIYEEQPYLANVYPGDTKKIDTIFCLKDYRIEYFCLSARPITRQYFVVGEAEPIRKGYFIADDCIGCGVCQTVCPQEDITEGTPFSIDPEHCLQCGNCFENCPVGVIHRI